MNNEPDLYSEDGFPLWTSPQLKELTYEEIEDCFPENGCSSTEDGFGLVVSAQFLHDFARAILRKAQEK